MNSKFTVEQVNLKTGEITPTAEGHVDLVTDHIQAMFDAAARGCTENDINFTYPDRMVPNVIALYNDIKPATASIADRMSGELIGWATLHHDYFDSKQAVRGTRVPDKFLDEILPDGSRKRRYVVEFGTTQALGSFNKVRLFGADASQSESMDDAKRELYTYLHVDSYNVVPSFAIPNKGRRINEFKTSTSGLGLIVAGCRTNGNVVCAYKDGVDDTSPMIAIVGTTSLTTPDMLGAPPTIGDNYHEITLPFSYNDFTSRFAPLTLNDAGDLLVSQRYDESGVGPKVRLIKYLRSSNYRDSEETVFPLSRFSSSWNVCLSEQNGAIYAIYGTPNKFEFEGANVTSSKIVIQKLGATPEDDITMIYDAWEGIANIHYVCTSDVYLDSESDCWYFIPQYHAASKHSAGQFSVVALENKHDVSGYYPDSLAIVGKLPVSEITSTTGYEINELPHLQGASSQLYTWFSGGYTQGVKGRVGLRDVSFSIGGFDPSRKAYSFHYEGEIVYLPACFLGRTFKVAESSMPPITHSVEDDMVLRVTYEYIVKYEEEAAPVA